MIPQWLAAPEWTPVVKTLLHTLWQGMVLAVFLGLALRRLVNPAVRYRCALGALGGVMICGLVTWALLSGPPALASNPAPDTVPADAATTTATVSSALPPLVVNFSQPEPQPLEMPWTAWLALLWVAGATLMLGRAGFQVAGAERLRRAARPLEDARLVALLADARRAVGLARRVRLAVTEKLSSPVVAGVLVPTLIIPLSLTTTLTQDQLRFILLHELAHIRRGDYFANLFQLFAEALLFFNPAVWWISRQMRLEREACCDALAVELSGAPADYARTLLHVVENVLSPAPAAAPAFGDPREPSTLADRLQRMLVPGYRPALRLTWRAMFAALLTGGTLLFLSALGTRVTIAAILTPQQRIERIEKKMTEYGESPVALNANGDEEHAPKVKIAGHIRMADGSPVPQWVSLNLYSSVPRSSSSSAVYARDGKFSSSIRAGTIYLGAETTNYAPAVVGPLDGLSTNAFEDLEIIFDSGFDVPLQVVDEDSGKPLTNGTIATLFWMSNHGFQPQALNPGIDGSTTLTHCAELPLDITVNVPGYEIVQKHFEHVRRGENLRVALRRGNAVSGTVLDRATGRPVAGAEFHLLYQSGGEEARRFQWTDAMHLLGTSDANGAFSLAQLQPGKRYYLGVTSPGHESVVLEKISPGAKPFTVRLGPELIVRGHVTGSIDDLQQVNRDRVLNLNTTEMFEQNSYGDSQRVPLQVSNGLITFQFTNRAAGRVTLSGQSYREERDITAPVDDWIVDLRQTKPVAAQVLPTREVIFRFKHPSGVPPRGLVSVSIPDITDPKNLTSRMQDLEITNGEVHVQIAVGGQTLVESKRMVGYWFNHWNIAGPSQPWVTVTAGPGPLIFDIPLIAAGAIYAQARNVDGTPAGGLFFGVSELKPAPGRGDSTLDGGSDSFSSDAPRKWVSGPLPLGGTYQVHAWRGNAFCVSRTVKLTEANPDAVVELHFAPGKTFQGTVLDAGGKPLRDAELKISFSLADNHSFGLKSVFTDARGNFTLENTAPDLGTYSAEAIAPGHVAEVTKFNFKSQPQIIRLKPGRTLGGRLVESGTGLAIPGAEVRALVVSSPLPIQTTHADADGRFQFNTLGDGEYTLFVEDGQNVSNQKCRANGNTNLTVKVKLYAWSKVKPKLQSRAETERFDEPVATVNAGQPSPIHKNNIADATVTQSTPTNTLSVKITAQFGWVKSEELSRATSRLKFNRGYRSDNSWWTLSPTEHFSSFSKVLSSPQLQTFDGQSAQLYIGTPTNGFSFDCTPSIDGNLIKLAVHAHLVEDSLTSHDFLATAGAENGGCVLFQLDRSKGTSVSNLVGTLRVQIVSNQPSVGQLRVEGRTLYEAGKLAEAREKFKAAQTQDPQNAAAQYFLDLVDAAVQNPYTNRVQSGREKFEPNASSIQPNLGAKTAENEPANGPTNIIVKATPVSMASANWSPTNGPSILITTHFSRIDAQSFDRLTSNLRFNAGYRSDDNWWSISPRELHAQGITDFGFVAGMSLGSPRLQTFSGQEAEIYIGNGTNGLWFDCTPTIHNGLIDLAMHGKVVEENKNVVSTNQFQAHAAAENLGTVIVRLKGTGYPPTSYLVAAINVQINYNRSATNQNRSLSVTERSPLDDALLAEDLLKEGKRLYGLQKFDEAKDKLTAVLALNSDAREAQYYLKELSRTPAQRAIVAKLQRLRVPAPGANHLKNLDELVQWLNQVANEKDAQQPDIRFRIDPNTRGSTSVFLPAMDLPLINILDNVTSMNGVNQLIQYTVVDDGVVFSQAAAKPFVYTGPGRQAIIAKLDKIHFDSVYYDDLPLNEVLKQLAEQCRLRDPEHKGINFLINNTPARPQASLDQLTGLPMNLATNTGAAGSQPVDVGAYLIKLPSLADVRLADVLDALVRTSDHPLQYSVQDFAIVFSARGPTNTPLFMRTFGVDFNTLSSRFRLISPTNQSGDRVLLNGGFTNISGTTTRIARLNPDGTLDTAFSATNLLAQDSASAPAQLARNFFATLGIDLANPPGKSVFFNDRLGRLSVRATAADLDKIEKALAQLEEPPASTNAPNVQAQPTANPPPVDQLLAEGKTLYEAGKLAQAREKLKAAHAQDPKNATAQYYLTLIDAPVQNQKTNHLQSGREKILTQLDRIHIHSLSYDNLKLEQVIRQLNEAADPEKLGFNISTATNAAMPQWSDINSVIINIPGLIDVRLADVLDAMVLVADKPIKYSILDSGIVFSGKSTNSPQLFLRTFRIDPNTFYSGLENVHASDLPSLGNIGVTNHGGSRIPTQDSNSPPSRLAKAFFTTLGVDFDNPPGKSVFFNDRLGSLFVKATEMDLDTIERAIQILNQAPPQVHLKVRYYEVPHGSASGFLSPGGTNATAGRFSSTLTDPNFRATLKALFVQTDVENLGEAEVTVITGRQTQMQLKKPGAAAENWNLIHGQVVMPPTEHEARGYIDIVPYVLSDGYTINLAVIPSGIFQLRNVVTTANVWDNQTLVVDCLHGDKKDRDLLIFITATIVGPAGSRVHTDDEMPYAQTNIPSQPAPPAKQLNSIAATNPVAPSNSVQPTLPATNPQLHLKARFIETPKGTLDDLGKFLNATNPTDGQPMGILFAQDAESAIQTLKARKGFEIRAEPEITVTSGRRVQMRATDMITVVTNLIFQQPQGHPLLALSKPQITGTGDQQVQMRSTDGTTPANNLQAQYGQTVNPGTSSIQPQTSSVEVGTTLEMVPHVLSDGFSVNLTAMPSLTEFYGYKDLGMVTNRTSNPASFKSEKIQLPIISPQFRTQKLDANVNLWDGQTLVLSGFKTRSFQSASKPKSGDTPTLGRLFTHTNSVDKDLLIFITATIVDSTDRRIHSDADLAGLPPQPPQP